MDSEFDKDTDNASTWSETPETNYFKMMMQDNHAGRVTDNDMADSVIGGETLASVMNGDIRDNNNNANVIVSEGVASLPNETMSIVGVEDDVSTIANDTVNETTKAFFNGHGSREDSKPRIRLFKEYNTPEKQNKESRKYSENGGSTDDDDETVPETPPGMIRVPGHSSSSSDKEKEIAKAGMKEVSTPVRSKKHVYICAGVLAVVLFASIIALSVALNGMRDVDDSSSSTINSSPSFVERESDGNDILEIWPDLDMDNNNNNLLDGKVDTKSPLKPTPDVSAKPSLSTPSLNNTSPINDGELTWSPCVTVSSRPLKIETLLGPIFSLNIHLYVFMIQLTCI